jgi:hypothetical protein
MPRELIEPHKGGKRCVRRKGGKFTTNQKNVGRSLSADRRSKAKTVVKKGGGRPRRPARLTPSFPPPGLSKRCHSRPARFGIAVHWASILVFAERESPHP